MPVVASQRMQRNISLAAATATGPGTEITVPPSLVGGFISGFTWDVVLTGSPTSVTVDLEGTIDGTTWAVYDNYTGSADTQRHVANKPGLRLRANLTALSGGSSPTVSSLSLIHISEPTRPY